MLTFIRQRTILFVLLLGLVSTACIPITEEDFANSPEGVQTILQAFFAYFTSSSTDVVAEDTSSLFAANSAAPIVLSTNVQDFAQAGTTAAGGPNENCPAGTAELAKFNWNDSTSTYDLEGVNNGGVVISGDEISGTWTSTRPISHVLIKGALEVDTDVYSPPATSGSFDNSEIFTPNQPNNADISNIKFCGPTRGTISVEKLVSTGDPNTPNQTFTLNILTAGGTTLNSDDSITNGGVLSSSELSAGAYVVSETDLAANWSLDDLSCSSEYGNSIIGVANLGSDGGSIAITLGAGDIVYCIASNSFELPPELVDIRVIKYNDLNQNGDNDEVNIGPSGGPTGNTLTGWQFVLYNGQGTEIAAGTTFAENPSSPNDLGIRVTFADLLKNDTYTICEVPQAGWVNSDPGANTDPDPTGQGRPCATINTSNAGSIAIRYFGNYEAPRVDIRVIKYNDLNQNGTNDEVNTAPSGGPTGNTLTGWQFVLYNGQGTEIAAGTTFAENPGSPNDLGIRVTFADLPKNDTYTICEVPQAGWVNSDPGANTDPDPTGQGRPCETINTSNAGNIAIRYFGNYQLLGSITILKNVDDDSFADTPFDFLFDGSTNFSISENDGAYVISDLPAGSYTVQETVPANWDLTSIGCNVPNNNTALSDGLTIVLEAGEDEVCTFNNVYTPPPALGSITILKNVDDDSFADMPFDFLFDGNTNFSISENDGAYVISDLPAGSYTVQETVPANWDLTSIGCNVPNNNTALSDGLTIVLEAGEDEVCTFNNVHTPPQDGTLSIKKVVDPNPTGAPDFGFTGDYFAGEIFLLHNQSQPPVAVASGTYSFSESVPIGWEIASVVCNANGQPVNYSMTNASSVSVDVGAGEDVVCTVTNTRLGNIIVFKQVSDEQYDRQFSFVFDDGSSQQAFYLSDTGLNTPQIEDGVFDNLPAGNYTITEDMPLPAGWTYVGSVCSPEANPIVTNVRPTTPLANGFSIDLQPGETVYCFLGNAYQAPPQLGSITIYKNVDDDSFADMPFDFVFNGSTNFSISENGAPFVVTDLPAGNYSVVETVPSDWDLANIDCGPNNNTGLTDGLTIVLEAGEEAVCTFNNVHTPPPALGSITILKNVNDNSFADAEFDFVFNGGTNFSISENGGGWTISGLGAGTYNVTETVPADWDLGYVDCGLTDVIGVVDGVNIVLDAGEDAVCTFNNFYTPPPPVLGSITIYKNVDDDSFADMPFDFVFNGGTNFSISENSAPYVVTDLPAGNYSVVETVPSDWDLANIDCRPNNNTGLTDGLTIVLEAGEEAVCTFNNVHTPPPPKASITIVKSVNWNGVPVNGSQTFDLCINSVAFSSPQCQTVGANGGSVSFADLDLGVYDVYELDPGSDWTVTGGTSVTLDTPDQQASVTITNTRNIVLLPLTLEAVCPAGTIIVTNPNGFPVDFQYNGQSYSVGANSTAQITAQPGETITITFNGGNATITAKLTTDCGTVSQEPGLTCPANWTLIGESRAVLGINHPNVVFEVNYNFNLDGAFQDYQVAVLVASAVGHPEAGCLIGGGNDGGTYPCDQGQNYESFNVLFDGGQVASIPDHGEDQWQSFGNVYSATIGAGAHTVTYRHIGQGTTPESVTYKSIICVLAGQPVVTQAAPVESQAVTQPEQAPPPQEKEEEVPPVEEEPTEGEQPAEVEEPVQGDESVGGEGEGAQPTDTPDKSGDESAEG